MRERSWVSRSIARQEFVHKKGKPGKPTMSLRRRPGVGSLLPRRTVLILLVGLCMCTYMAEGGKQKKGKKARGGEATGGGGGGALEGKGSGAGGSTARGKCPLGQGATLQQLIGKGEELFGKDWERSEACYQLALDQAPQSSLAAYNVGLSQMYQHKSDSAIASFNQAISIDPKYGDAYFGLGSALYERAQGQGQGQGQGGSKGGGSGHDQASDLKAAENALVKSTKMSPKNHAAYNSLGNVYLATGKMELALSAYRSVSKHSPKSPEGYANAGRVLLGMGRGNEALRAMMDAADLAPANAALQYELAMALKGLGREEEAKRFLRMATRLDQTLAAAHYQLGELQSGTIYTENKDIPGAIRSHTLAIRHDPSMAEAYMSLAMLHWNLGRLFMAEILLKEGLSLKPMGEIAANLGIVQNDLGKKDDAILSLQKSMELSPRLAEAPKCLGDVYKEVQRWDDAIKMYNKALAIRPDYWEALNDLVHSLQHTCAWSQWGKKLKTLQKQLGVELRNGDKPLFVKPFHALVYPLKVEHMLLVASSYAARATRLVRSQLPRPFALSTKLAPGKKLRVGWVSSNIGDHSLSHLMRSVFGMHGSKVEAWVFALNGDGDPGDPKYRNEIRSAVGASRFVDISGVSGVQGAHIVNSKSIHVLVDLVGYTGGGERANEVFASSPARHQISYMGFCASSGAPYMHHIVSDRVASPPELRGQFSEGLMLLPNSYFVNDHRQQQKWAHVGHKIPDRSSFKELPAKGRVAACFNQLYKIDPPVFEAWMNLLKRSPGTVLWLLKFPQVAVANIRKEAKKRGVGPDRIAFGETLAKTLYLERGAVADIFLDTPLVNAHTSATDILWAGVPMLTMPRESMISRVAASLALAAGLGYMVVPTLSEYERLSVSLLGDGNGEAGEALSQMRANTIKAREDSPLFDTQGWVTSLDSAMGMAWECALTGKTFHVIASKSLQSR